MNDFAQNLFDFTVLVGAFMLLLFVCAVVAKAIYLRRLRLDAPTEPDGEIVVPRYVIANGTEAMKRAAETIKVQNALIDAICTQNQRGHLVFDCKCDECEELTSVLVHRASKLSEELK